MASVELRGLTKEFPGGTKAIDDLSLVIEDGEFFALLGPSGCGKTTLLRTIAGLELPTAGAVLIDGTDVTAVAPGKRDVAMVFQDYALYPHMSVTDNIAYPLKIRRIPRGARRATAAEVAGGLQLSALLDRRPGQLSGGQQQRVALARAIGYHPRLFLFDEPLSNLDARLRLEARTFLKRLQNDLGVTTIYVTHDQAEALALADHIAVMKEGRIEQRGTPLEVFTRPASLFVAGFIGSVPMNLLPANRVRVPVPDSVAGDVIVGIRPEYATLHDSPTEAAFVGAVTVVELLGTDYLVTVEDGDTIVQVTAPEPPPVDARVWVTFDPRRVLLYRPDGSMLEA